MGVHLRGASPDTIKEKKKARKVQDAYAMGAKVSHNGKHWTSELDNNTYEPGVYGWAEQSD